MGYNGAILPSSCFVVNLKLLDCITRLSRRYTKSLAVIHLCKDISEFVDGKTGICCV